MKFASFIVSLVWLAASAVQVTVETTTLDGRKTSVVQPLEVRNSQYKEWRQWDADGRTPQLLLKGLEKRGKR